MPDHFFVIHQNYLIRYFLVMHDSYVVYSLDPPSVKKGQQTTFTPILLKTQRALSCCLSKMLLLLVLCSYLAQLLPLHPCMLNLI